MWRSDKWINKTKNTVRGKQWMNGFIHMTSKHMNECNSFNGLCAKGEMNHGVINMAALKARKMTFPRRFCACWTHSVWSWISVLGPHVSLIWVCSHVCYVTLCGCHFSCCIKDESWWLSEGEMRGHYPPWKANTNSHISNHGDLSVCLILFHNVWPCHGDT